MNAPGERRRSIDPVSGLGLGVPRGWRELPIDGSPLLVLVAPPQDGFAPTLVASVSEAADVAAADTAIADGVRVWLRAVRGARLLDAAPIDDLVDGVTGRRWTSVHSPLGRPLLVLSAALHHAGLLTRLDLTVALDAAEGADELLMVLLSDVDLPTAPGERAISASDAEHAVQTARELAWQRS